VATVATRTRPRPAAKNRKAPALRPAKKKQPGLTARAVDVLAGALRTHAGDPAGLALVVVGLLSAMGVYAHAAGPVGDALHDAYREALGDGRYIVPVALIAIGVLMIWGKAPEIPTAVTIGFALCIASACGLLGLVGTGGFVGDAIAGPLQSALATPGAALVLVAAAAFGLLLVTRTPLRTVPGLVVRGWKWFSPEPREEVEEPEPVVDEAEPFDEPEPELEPEPVEIHVPVDDQPKGEQLAIELGPAAEPGTWKLPPLNLLKRGKAQKIDERMVNDTGRALVTALATHGVETQLVGMTVGPTVTRYELELAPGVKVSRVTNLHKDIA